MTGTQNLDRSCVPISRFIPRSNPFCSESLMTDKSHRHTSKRLSPQESSGRKTRSTADAVVSGDVADRLCKMGEGWTPPPLLDAPRPARERWPQLAIGPIVRTLATAVSVLLVALMIWSNAQPAAT